MPNVSVLIKPASSLCRLRCEYCFYREIARRRAVESYGLMSEEVLGQITEKTLAFADGFAEFSFQGGEPTLRGLDFFRRAMELQRRYNRKNVAISNCLQTNGVELDEAWAEFLRENRFLVGISLDGPEDVHDFFRRDAEGRGTHGKVMRAIGLLREYGVEFNVLFVVNSRNAREPERLYDYFRDNGLAYLQPIPCLEPQGETPGGRAYSLENADYAAFLKGFFDRWYADLSAGREVSVRFFDNLVRAAMGLQPETCTMLGSCRCQYVFEADGSVYPCDFYTTDEWRMGNIRTAGLAELYASPAAERFAVTSLPVAEKCRRCRWYGLCRGGCRRDKAADTLLNRYCEAYCAFFEYAHERIRLLAERFSR